MTDDILADANGSGAREGAEARALEPEPLPAPDGLLAPPTLPAASVGGADGGGAESRERDAARRRGDLHRQASERARAEGHGAASPPQVERRAPRVAERAFPVLADNVRDYAIFLMDPAGLITYWGEGARFIKWWMREEVEGAHLRMLYLDGGSEDGTAEDHLAEAARTGESASEGQRVRRDGSTFWAGVALTALREDDGTLLGFSKVTRDLTARRAADAALVANAEADQARAAAEAVAAARSRFLATMSHEIRTPINAVLGYADLLAVEIEGPLTDGQRRYVERLRTSGRHLAGLVDEVLDLSRLNAGHVALTPAVGRVGEVVRAALALVEPQAGQRGLVLVDEVSTHAGGLSYWGDEARVRQILVNVLANAVKFTEPTAAGPGRVTVSAGATAQPPAGVQLAGAGPWVTVRVEDTGRGIPPDQHAAIFEPFVQPDREHHRPVEGTGLGLAISRRLARQMGGDLSVQSAPAVGAAFVLWLPVAPLESLRTGGA